MNACVWASQPVLENGPLSKWLQIKETVSFIYRIKANLPLCALILC